MVSNPRIGHGNPERPKDSGRHPAVIHIRLHFFRCVRNAYLHLTRPPSDLKSLFFARALRRIRACAAHDRNRYRVPVCQGSRLAFGVGNDQQRPAAMIGRGPLQTDILPLPKKADHVFENQCKLRLGQWEHSGFQNLPRWPFLLFALQNLSLFVNPLSGLLFVLTVS